MNRAAQSSIQSEVADLHANWAHHRWLRAGNRYERNCLKRIKTDAGPNRKVRHQHLREYIAASSVLHAIDGWSFLGRALDAHLRGDLDSSRHLGYYAELRAAMALLAAEGIGVFGNIHVIVNSRRRCECIRASTTHEFVWDALQHWSTTSAASDLLFRIVEPGGIPLADWLNRFSAGASLRFVLAERWLLKWGLDLSRFAEDRDARNLSSYRPTAFAIPRALSVKETLKFAREFWMLYEPSESVRFGMLDRHLLRHALDLAFNSAHAAGRTRKQAKRMFQQQVASMLHGLSPEGLNDEQWRRFLAYDDSEHTPLLLAEAAGTAGRDDPNHPRQVLARAFLLLRIATGACHALLQSLPGTVREHLRFWWSGLGEDHGLWNAGDEPDRFVDLWADIREACGDLDAWEQSVPSGSVTYKSVWCEKPSAAAVLGSCERIGLWGIGI